MAADALEFYRQWINPGALVFDIGANVGERTEVFLDLGARVVAVEPQPAILQALRDRIANRDRLVTICYAVSDKAGAAPFYVSPGTEYVSTLEDDYRLKVQTHASYPYADPVTVATITLDLLIAWFGVPVFCKIDVEGHERAVLDGLTQPLPALSFEVHDFDLEKAEYCIVRLNRLGDYEYAFSSRDTFAMVAWPSPVDIFGDIYATLR